MGTPLPRKTRKMGHPTSPWWGRRLLWFELCLPEGMAGPRWGIILYLSAGRDLKWLVAWSLPALAFPTILISYRLLNNNNNNKKWQKKTLLYIVGHASSLSSQPELVDRAACHIEHPSATSSFLWPCRHAFQELPGSSWLSPASLLTTTESKAQVL